MTANERMHSDFNRAGFLLLKNCIPRVNFDELEENILGLAERITGVKATSLHDPELMPLLQANRGMESRLYDEVRDYDWLSKFSLHPSITEPVEGLVGEPCGLLRKIPFRVDLPQVVREVAVWHQDFFYVHGNQQTVTAWIPMQDTTYRNGCLMVMPGSHTLGALEHDNVVIQKRHFPSGIFERDVRYVEMEKGDMLLFHSLLLHSSGLNISDSCRFSLQARYSPLSGATAEHMGGLLPCRT